MTTLLDEAPAGDLQRRINALKPWFHNLRLDGIETAPDHFLGDFPAVKWRGFKDAIPADLSGRTVLDIGCNAGFYALEMKRRGAELVVAIDSDPDYLAQGRLAAAVEGLDIRFEQRSVYDVAGLGQRFDVVLFLGVLYHLRHPLLALDLIHRYAAADLLVFQSMQRGSPDVALPAADYPFSEAAIFDQPGWPRLSFIEHDYAGDCTNWWVPNRAASMAMLRSAGFTILANPEAEVFVARRIELPEPPDGPRAVHPAGGRP